jgi:hypothetical protein
MDEVEDMNIVTKKILVSAILLISSLISYITSKLFVVSRCETLTIGIKENGDVLIFLFFFIGLVLFASSKLEKRFKTIFYLSIYIIVVLAYFYDLFNFTFKIISIAIILISSLLSGISLRIKEEENHDYFKEQNPR